MEAAGRADYDLVVIGSGIGGLTVASLASRLLGFRVLVLEAHWQLGGFTHAFTRGRWRWDVGLHYVGGLAPGSPSRRLVDLVTGGLGWHALPDRFEALHLPDGRVDLHWREAVQARELKERFPAEAKAIDRYYADLARMRARFGLALFAPSAPPLLRAGMRLASLRARRLGALTTADYLDGRFADPALKRLLACRWGDFGLAPRESAFGLHALVMGSYAEGAGRPDGGAPALAASVARIVRAHGGDLRTRAPVERIVVEHGRATGVEVRRRDGTLEALRAPRVVSAAGAIATYRHMLRDVALPDGLLAHLDALAPRTSAAVLYLGLRDDPACIGLAGENHWLVGEDALERSAATVDEVGAGRAPLAFVSTAPGARGGSQPRLPTAQVVVPMTAAGMERWSALPWKKRGDDYAALKARLQEGLLAQAERHLPGLRALVGYAEVSTPLTVATMTGHPGGAIYGLAGTPLRVRAPLGARTPVAGLWLAGADVCSPGIQGALMGGVFATAAMMGARGMPAIMRAAARTPPDER